MISLIELYQSCKLVKQNVGFNEDAKWRFMAASAIKWRQEVNPLVDLSNPQWIKYKEQSLLES